MIYRNKKLLEIAKYVPYCMGCGKISNGTIVAAHSNQIRDGKGTGHKAHDYRIAYLCHCCHMAIDSGQLTREEKLDAWESAHRKTIAWLFETGAIK